LCDLAGTPRLYIWLDPAYVARIIGGGKSGYLNDSFWTLRA